MNLPVPVAFWRWQRQWGFIEQARHLGTEVAICPPDQGDGPEAAEQARADWLRSLPRPIAMFLPIDDLADWYRSWLPQQGLRVPADIALIGCGDQLVCQQYQPELSSVAYPWKMMGEAAASWIHKTAQGSMPETQKLRALRVINRHTTPGLRDHDPLMRKAMRWLEQHLSSTRPTEELAKHLGISATWLNNTFRNQRRSTPKKEHSRLRLEKATNLIETTNLSLGKVATTCGFPSATTFGVAFRRRHGCSPRTWRRNYSKQSSN